MVRAPRSVVPLPVPQSPRWVSKWNHVARRLCHPAPSLDRLAAAQSAFCRSLASAPVGSSAKARPVRTSPEGSTQTDPTMGAFALGSTASTWLFRTPPEGVAQSGLAVTAAPVGPTAVALLSRTSPEGGAQSGLAMTAVPVGPTSAARRCRTSPEGSARFGPAMVAVPVGLMVPAPAANGAKNSIIRFAWLFLPRLDVGHRAVPLPGIVRRLCPTASQPGHRCRGSTIRSPHDVQHRRTRHGHELIWPSRPQVPRLRLLAVELRPKTPSNSVRTRPLHSGVC